MTGRHALRASSARVQSPGEAPQLIVRQGRRAGRRQPPPQRASPEHHMPPPLSQVARPFAPRDTHTLTTRHHSPRAATRLTLLTDRPLHRTVH